MNTLTTVLRIAGVFAVLLLAGFGILFVLGVIPYDALAEGVTQSALTIGILAAASLIIGLLFKK